MPTQKQSFTATLEFLQDKLKGRWVIGTPLGIGKPNPMINAIYQHARENPTVSLDVFTALSLEIPKGKSLLEKRFLNSFTRRFFGQYPELDYIQDVKNNALADNIIVREFYLQSGKMLRSKTAQQQYVSSNYTHVARDMVDRDVNVILQMVSCQQVNGEKRYSLSCNPDLTADILKIANEKGKPRPLVIAMVNNKLPYMGGQAEVEADFFDLIHDEPSCYFEPFATPAQSINATDYSIGLLASTLIQDGGTLQIGIGSLADALVYSTQLRHEKNDTYLKLLTDSGMKEKNQAAINQIGELSMFSQGLYAASEMFVEGFAHLFDSGILKRKVYPDAEIQRLLNQKIIGEHFNHDILETLLNEGVIDARITKRQFNRLQNLGVFINELKFENGMIIDKVGKHYPVDLNDKNLKSDIEQHCLGDQLKQGVVLHAAFFMGSKRFYDWLRNLEPSIKSWFQMTPVSQINELYGGEALDRVQRIKARFVNTCMKVDLLGAAASDTLENQQVVSGVGGQYNFVAMAHTLSDSRSILMLRSVHSNKNKTESNIVWTYGYCTIPRHLRDVVITEYGMADLRGQSDEVCIQRMICIADSRFQEGLRKQAVLHNKLPENWQVPESFKNNTPELVNNQFMSATDQGYFPSYPFGEDFTQHEKTLIAALTWLKTKTRTKSSAMRTVFKALWSKPEQSHLPFLETMDLKETVNLKEKISSKLLSYALKQCHD